MLIFMDLQALSFVHGPRISSVFRDSVFITAETDDSCFLQVIYGEESGIMSETAYCSSPDTFHSVVLRHFNATRSWKYSVIIQNAQDTVQTPERVFRMPAAPGERFTFAVLGDAHCTAGSGGIPPEFTANIANICAYDPDFVLFLGDGIHNSYYQSEVRQQWDNFKIATDTIAYNRPIFMVIGNHDVNTWYHNFNGGDILADEFEMPRNAPMPEFYDELVYFFGWGDATFYILDSDYYDNPEIIDVVQRNWLVQNISTGQSRFKITAHHEHAWSTTGDLYGFLGEHPEERDAYWKVLRDNGVILDMAGHIHLYNRDFFGRPLPDTITCVNQLISGGAGGSIVGGYGGDFHHFCLIEVNGNTLSITAIDYTGAIRDNFSLTAVEETAEPVFDRCPVEYMSNGFKYYAEIPGELRVFDQTGRVLFEKRVQPGQHADFLTDISGVYFLMFDSGEEVYSNKFTVMR